MLALFDRMVQWGPSCETGREKTLKGRLAEAVRDENLRREQRCFNIESPELGYFDHCNGWRVERVLGLSSNSMMLPSLRSKLMTASTRLARGTVAGVARAPEVFDGHQED